MVFVRFMVKRSWRALVAGGRRSSVLMVFVRFMVKRSWQALVASAPAQRVFVVR
jgi:hypothetical protein